MKKNTKEWFLLNYDRLSNEQIRKWNKKNYVKLNQADQMEILHYIGTKYINHKIFIDFDQIIFKFTEIGIKNEDLISVIQKTMNNCRILLKEPFDGKEYLNNLKEREHVKHFNIEARQMETKVENIFEEWKNFNKKF